MKHRFFSLFKIPKHRKFEYQPRYYDPEKEEVRKMVEHLRAKKQEQDEDQEWEVNIRYEFKSLRQRNTLQSENKKRIFRLIVIFLGLVGLFYLATLFI